MVGILWSSGHRSVAFGCYYRRWHQTALSQLLTDIISALTWSTNKGTPKRSWIRLLLKYRDELVAMTGHRDCSTCRSSTQLPTADNRPTNRANTIHHRTDKLLTKQNTVANGQTSVRISTYMHGRRATIFLTSKKAAQKLGTWGNSCPYPRQGEVGVQLHSFLTSALDGDNKWLTSRPGHFTPGKNPGTHSIGG